MEHVTVVGLGGIGSALVEPLCRFLSSLETPPSVELIDGDKYELKNLDRQRGEGGILLNKALAQKEAMEKLFPKLTIIAHETYLTLSNAPTLLQNNSAILSCVDNHKTRKLIQEQCYRLSDVTLISGGNELYDGNVQIFIRRNRRNRTSPITLHHPEIDNPADRSPDEMSCEELQKSEPQLLFTNLTVACLMLNAFWKLLTNAEQPHWTETYFDLKTGAFRSCQR